MNGMTWRSWGEFRDAGRFQVNGLVASWDPGGDEEAQTGVLSGISVDPKRETFISRRIFKTCIWTCNCLFLRMIQLACRKALSAIVTSDDSERDWSVDILWIVQQNMTYLEPLTSSHLCPLLQCTEKERRLIHANSVSGLANLARILLLTASRCVFS